MRWSAVPFRIPILLLAAPGLPSAMASRKYTPDPITTTSALLDPVEERNSNSTKTVYLIRHAESEENVRARSMKHVLRGICQCSLPTSEDLCLALEWGNIPAMVNSDVSSTGFLQIQYMADLLQENRFLEKHGVQLVAHSPLRRARKTCLGLMGSIDSSEYGHQANLNIAPSFANRVVELPLLKETSPAEFVGIVPTFHGRLRALEDWIERQPESVIVLVGHSHFFKCLLHLDFRFDNCDVWQVNFDGQRQQYSDKRDPRDTKKSDYPTLPAKWFDLRKMYTCALPDEESTREEAASSQIAPELV